MLISTKKLQYKMLVSAGTWNNNVRDEDIDIHLTYINL